MSWNIGTDLACDVWDAVLPYINEDSRHEAADKVIEVMEAHGCEMDWGACGDDPLSVANRKASMVQHGAPRYPVEGDTVIAYGDEYRWDGFEWVNDGDNQCEN